jgi:hypothetical protein
MKRTVSMKLAALSLLASLAFVAAASAAPTPIPGIRSPSGNIKCLYIPRFGATGRPELLCQVAHAAYGARLQKSCSRGKAGLDWHGFELPTAGKARVVCAGGVLYDPRTQKPTYALLRYGRTWKHGAFTCVSRVAGVTCTSPAKHGLFVSRQSYRIS